MGKRGFFLLVIAVVGLFGICSAAEFRNLPLTGDLVESGTLIVDIRMAQEWRETGVVPGSLLLTFFNADRSYDLDSFIAELLRHTEPDREIALLCRSGNRSAKVAGLLSNRGFSSIINVTGGIRTAAENGIELVPYRTVTVPPESGPRDKQ